MKKPMALFSSLLPLFLLLFFFFATKLLAAPLSNNPPPSRCPSFDCGNGLRLSYPFWKNDKGTDSPYTCGYREFGIRCDPKGEPVLTLPSDDYYVRDISYSDATVTLVDIDVSTEQCPRARRNLTLPILPVLDYSPLDLNLTFYFNCSSSPSDSFLPIECLLFGALRSYVTDQRDGDVEELNWVGLCQDKVVATVRSEEINVNGLIGGYEAALKSGFVLDWRAVRQCGACEASNGYCGYNTTAPASFLCFCDDGSARPDHCPGSNSRINWKLKLLVGAASTIVGLLILSILAWKMRDQARKSFGLARDPTIEAFIRNHGTLSPRRYKFSEVKRITSSFKRKLGQGGYGGVYQGKLEDGRLVAVKVLNTSKGDGQDFINEVASISRTSHVNVVSLLGFCLEGKTRALIYEFMPNGSLEKFIFKKNDLTSVEHLGWEKLYNIALGIARGLQYLHQGCNTRIVHFDIKPHNILLDENFHPKISDFGLAKLCTRNESILSMMEARGTIGYIAPEVFSRNFGVVSHKSDVYSYGMMVLEMAGGRRNLDVQVSQTSEVYFPHLVYRHLEQGTELKLQGVITSEGMEIVRKMIMVGLWCIQPCPSDRPSMSKVLEMFEGSIQALQIPPNPFLSSPPRLPQESTSTLCP